MGLLKEVSRWTAPMLECLGNSGNELHGQATALDSSQSRRCE